MTTIDPVDPLSLFDVSGQSVLITGASGAIGHAAAVEAYGQVDSDFVASGYDKPAASVKRGDLGAKTGCGFYDWAPGEADRRRAEISRGLAGQNQECNPAPADEDE